MPMSTISTSASPADFSRIARNGGENIWESALMAASSIGFLRCRRPKGMRRAAQGDRTIAPRKNLPRRVVLSVLDHAASEPPRIAMKRLSRRSFLAASAALAAGPAFGRAAPGARAAPDTPRSANAEVVIIGAGAAGIAAARRLAAAGKRCVVFEAADAIGGRCITDTRTFGVPYDRGAHWIYAADINPVAKLALQSGLDIYPAPPGQRMRIGRRYAREGEMEDFLASAGARQHRHRRCRAQERRRLRAGAAQGPRRMATRPSISCSGPYGCGKDLAEVSTVDFARAAERDNNAFCRQGFGALLAKLAAGLPVQLATPVTRIEYWSRHAARGADRPRARSDPRAVIVTASTNVLAAGKIKFAPDLPKRQLDAVDQAQARQPRSHRAGADGQSARAAAPTSWCSRRPRASRPRRSSPMSRARRCA